MKELGGGRQKWALPGIWPDDRGRVGDTTAGGGGEGMELRFSAKVTQPHRSGSRLGEGTAKLGERE